jgi:iron complex transport system ATP-binding protein
MTSILEAQALTIDGRLNPTSVKVRPGELVALIGPNGSGKTSLLRAVAGVDQAAGNVRVAGEDRAETPPARLPHLLTFLPASRELGWPIAARDVIALGLPRPEPERVEALIDLLELGSLAKRPINSLSTGERARVLFARAMAPTPRLLLLDEPLSNLDPYWALRFLEIVRDFVSDGERSAIVALHDLDQAERFDRVLLMYRGSVLRDGSPRDVLSSTDLQDAFGIERLDGRWAIRRPADPQSSR